MSLCWACCCGMWCGCWREAGVCGAGGAQPRNSNAATPGHLCSSHQYKCKIHCVGRFPHASDSARARNRARPQHPARGDPSFPCLLARPFLSIPERIVRRIHGPPPLALAAQPCLARPSPVLHPPRTEDLDLRQSTPRHQSPSHSRVPPTSPPTHHQPKPHAHCKPLPVRQAAMHVAQPAGVPELVRLLGVREGEGRVEPVERGEALGEGWWEGPGCGGGGV